MKKHAATECKSAHRAVQDTLEVINGKWKLVILSTLFDGKKRFKELSREIGISPRMLSKELHELELNKMVKRTVCDTRPITVEYETTEHSETLWGVIEAMRQWGTLHRDEIFGKRNETTDAAVTDRILAEAE